MPRFCCAACFAKKRASSITPAVPLALSSAPGWIVPVRLGASEYCPPKPQVIVMRADDDVLIGLSRQ